MEKNMKILIVEDEANLLNLLKDEFTEEGFQVFTAKDGEEGFNQAVANKPDLILIDVLLPKMDGITMFKKLSQKEEFKKIPGIILTNLSDNVTLSNAMESGVYDFFVKSDWEPKNLVNQVKQRISSIRQTAS